MRFFIFYIKQCRYKIAAYVLCCIIFLSAFLLYRMPIKAAIYPLFISFLSGLMLLIYGSLKAREKHEYLVSLTKLSEKSLYCALPHAVSQNEADYQQIILLLRKEHGVLADKMNLKYLDMINYYTVWAHQIKTPIASMRLHLQNEDTALSQTLSAELSRVEQYVEMVLAFLRLNSESTDYVIQSYDLDSIVKQCIKRFSAEFITRKIRLDYEPLHKTIITDEKWLSFVIEQVLSNALKYTPHGNICIYIKEPMLLCISDSGIGIAPEDLPRIFDNGYTGYNGREDKKASGIGLYLCKLICNKLGHDITASSKPGRGTVIIMDLKQIKLNTK